MGLNNNKYQIGRGEKALKMESLDNLCSFSHGDFMNMSFDDNTFDAAYAIEVRMCRLSVVLCLDGKFSPATWFCLWCLQRGACSVRANLPALT